MKKILLNLCTSAGATLNQKLFIRKKIVDGKIYWKYKNKLYPDYLLYPGRVKYICPVAKKYCKGFGLDIGAGDDIFEGSYPIYDTSYLDAHNLHIFKDSSLDYIFSSHLLEHLDTWESALKLWIEKLKNKGVLFLYLPHKSMKLWLPNGLWIKKGDHKWVPTLEILKKFLIENKMEIIDYTTEPDKWFSFYVAARKRL